MINTQEIIKKYQEGNSISALEREYYPLLNHRNIKKILMDNNIQIRGGRKKKELTVEQFEYLKKKYCEESVDLKVLAKENGWDKETLRNLVQEKGLVKKTNNRVNKRLIEDYFEKIDSEEKAYFLGLLLTDGSVDKRPGRQGRIRLQLQVIDKDILIKFKNCLQIDSDLVIDPRGNQCCSIEFTCEKIYNDLSNYGIIPKKTYLTTNIPTNIPEEYLKDFLRGMLDGDGCITFDKLMSKDVAINFTSFHESFVRDFQQQIDSLINKQESNKLFYTSAWHCSWRGYDQVLKILDVLYENATIFLDRKYNLYQQLKDRK